MLLMYPDIDECTSNVHNCDENAVCNNTGGSFTCACRNGFNGNGTSCQGKSRGNLSQYFCKFPLSV